MKNTLATVQSIASQTLRSSATVGQAHEALESRLLALSRVHDVLTRESWDGADMGEIVAQALEPFGDPGGKRLRFEGPSVRLSPRAALALSMAFQELATNAVKYGSLSNGTGSVRIGWGLADGPDGHPGCICAGRRSVARPYGRPGAGASDRGSSSAPWPMTSTAP